MVTTGPQKYVKIVNNVMTITSSSLSVHKFSLSC